MKILIVSPNDLHPDSAAGVHTCEVVRAMRGLGHDVTLVARSGEDPGLEKITVVPLPLVGTLLTELGHLLRLVSLQRRKRFDLIYFRLEAHAFLVFLLRRLFAVPFYVEVNGDLCEELAMRGATRRLVRLARFAERFTITAADRILPVTETLGRVLAGRYPRCAARIRTVPNGVDTELFSPRASSEKSFIVGYVGSLVEWQDIDSLLQAAAELKNEEIFFEIIGDGARRSALENLRDQLGLKDRVIFRGNIPYRALPEFLARFSVAVVPKTPMSSGLLPLKFFQYLAMGLPVIVSDVPEMNHLVRESGAGLVFKTGDFGELKRRILELYRDAKRRRHCGEAARVLGAKYSWNSIARMILSDYETVKGEASRR